MPGDFPSYGYPFEPQGQVYLGDNPATDRLRVSLKFGMYPLANAKDELVEQYPFLGALMDRKDDAAFRRRLVQGLDELFSVVRGRVDEICDVCNFKVVRIALSIPCQWDLDFEDLYRSNVARVFGQPPSNISLHTETEALAHFLLHSSHKEIPTNNAYVLFLDFGGHSMVSSCIPFTQLLVLEIGFANQPFVTEWLPVQRLAFG